MFSGLAPPAKYYASSRSRGAVDLETLAERIGESTALNPADVLAVLFALLRTIPSELKAGN